ncbi:hypothetical protein L210DRAFT_1031481 [Boletus edulis BED1]|uniref:Uncharacterized protein n=1 Tax=Boletus edulis BED1 TaxID=1328754 RepID=A0AAD4BPW3_BOLED|nr:hypothetical protein L210DRAFT_1031481 [Boletus edulis BED1]
MLCLTPNPRCRRRRLRTFGTRVTPHSDPVALNSFFVLKNDPTPDRGSQLPRAAALIITSLGFIRDLQAGLLDPDAVRGHGSVYKVVRNSSDPDAGANFHWLIMDGD